MEIKKYKKLHKLLIKKISVYKKNNNLKIRKSTLEFLKINIYFLDTGG